MFWKKPITDRGITDIENKTDKAFLNFEDLNRIEGNLSYLSEQVKYIASFKTNWKMGDFVYEADFKRIYDALSSIVNAVEYKTTNETCIPIPPFNTYEKINAIENLTEILYSILNNKAK